MNNSVVVVLCVFSQFVHTKINIYGIVVVSFLKAKPVMIVFFFFIFKFSKFEKNLDLENMQAYVKAKILLIVGNMVIWCR